MKTPILAIISITICAVFIFCSSIIVGKYVDDLSSRVDELPRVINENSPDGLVGRIDDSLKRWRSHRSFLCLVISHREFDEIENALISLSAAVRSNDGGNYAITLDGLTEKLSKLKESESFTLDSII